MKAYTKFNQPQALPRVRVLLGLMLVAIGLTACGQRVEPPAAPNRIEDVNSY